MKLTPKQIKAYLRSGGKTCPYCESEELSASQVEKTHNLYTVCQRCGHEWTAVYTLTSLVEEVTPVVFRVWKKGERGVIALFPTIPCAEIGNCRSFEHVGQHGDANLGLVLSQTRAACLEDPEVQELKDELERWPYAYVLRPVQRTRPWWKRE